MLPSKRPLYIRNIVNKAVIIGNIILSRILMCRKCHRVFGFSFLGPTLMYTLHLNNHLFEQVLFISLNLDKRKPNRNLNTLINPIHPLECPIPMSHSLKP